MTLKRLFIFSIIAFSLVACSKEEKGDDPTSKEEEVKEYTISSIKDMTLREKVGQLFVIRPESLFCGLAVSSYTRLTDEQKDMFSTYPCGGIILFAQNITNPTQIQTFTSDIHDLKNYPFICVDEEGGTVARIAKNSNFNVPTFTSMGSIGASGDESLAYNAGMAIGSYLKTYGFDVDLAPVADVNSNPDNPVIGNRSFSSDPYIAAKMSSQFLVGLQNNTMEGCLKHFPGHGDTGTDSHYGYAETTKTWAEMLSCEMIPFKKGIQTGTKLIMTAHIGTPNVTGNNVPATMSSTILQDKLRDELGYKGLIITDGMEMGAITKQYSVSEAAVGVILAGVDLILAPANYPEAFDAVYSAVINGTISEERINESVERILNFKKSILDSRKPTN